VAVLRQQRQVMGGTLTGWVMTGWLSLEALETTGQVTQIHARLTESATEQRNPARQVEYRAGARPGQLEGEHHCWNLKMTGWDSDDCMGDDWMGDDWMGDDWMAFKLKVHQKLGALETTARVTRIHEGATEKRNPGQGEIHCEAARLEPGARRATLAAKQLVCLDCVSFSMQRKNVRAM
jgi:hypothetical protein